MKTLSTDLGNSSIKVTWGVAGDLLNESVPNKVLKTTESFNPSDITVTVKGAPTTIFSRAGEYVDNTRKVDDPLLAEKIAVAAFVSGMEEGTHSVVLSVGLPIEHHKAQKEEYAKRIKALSPIYATVTKGHKTVKFTLFIDKVLVNAEGHGILKHYAGKNIHEDAILLDVGNVTIDALFLTKNMDGTVSINNYKSIHMGIMKLAERLAKYLTEQEQLPTTIEKAERILLQGHFFKNGQKHSLKEHIHVLSGELNLIIQALKNIAVTFQDKQVILVGGGAEPLGNLLRAYIPHIEVYGDSQYWNANAFYLNLLSALQQTR